MDEPIDEEWNLEKFRIVAHHLKTNIHHNIIINGVRVGKRLLKSDNHNNEKVWKLLQDLDHDPENAQFDHCTSFLTMSEISSNDYRNKWKRIADNLKISFANTINNDITFRPIQIIPHLIPILGIILTESFVIILNAKPFDDHEDVPLRTFLLYWYSNIPKGSLQILNFMSKGLVEIYSQLHMRNMCPNFETKYFYCSPSMWIQYDVFGPICDALNTQQEQISLSDGTAKWVNREWDNYTYLTFLNHKAGRVRGKMQNHPIFPWVCDFTSEDGGFRPLDKTKYRMVKGDCQLQETYRRTPSHHIPELLSDIGYMIYRARVESKSNLCKHVRRKWVPEEYPVAISRLYEWTPDECIPEFYDDPSLFKSTHPDMADIEFPKFIKDADDFVRWHRKMLESDYVSNNLHKWIDLVFGYLLSEEHSENVLNSHLCFVTKNSTGLRTFGMVQLFDREHPKRAPRDYKPHDDCFRFQMDRIAVMIKSKENEEKEFDGINDENDLNSRYKRIRLENRRKNANMLSIVRIIAQIAVAEGLKGEFDNIDRILETISNRAHLIHPNYRKLFELLTNSCTPPYSFEIAFYIQTVLNIPQDISEFHDEFSKTMAYYSLRKCCIVTAKSKRSQMILFKEIESLKRSTLLSRKMEISVVASFQKLLESEEASIQAVHQLMPVIAKCLSESSLDDLIAPLVEIVKRETSVKLLDRRFLVYVSTCYGTRTFIQFFLQPIINACISKNEDRAIVAKETILWLAKRYGPVVCARFISSDLLRIMARCFDEFSNNEWNETMSVFELNIIGDQCCDRIEAIMFDIVAIYSVTFVTLQFLPFCCELIEKFKKRFSTDLESGLLAVVRIVDLSVRIMNDHQLMNHLENDIFKKIIDRIFELLLKTSTQFSSDRCRNLIICKSIRLLFSIVQRIGTENALIYAQTSFQLILDSFDADDDQNVYQIPMSMATQIVDKWIDEWGLQFLRSFRSSDDWIRKIRSIDCSQPPTTSMSAYNMAQMSTGNRLRPLSSTFQGKSTSISAGVNSPGQLNDVWCAHLSATMCQSKVLQFNQMPLCNFNGHTDRVRKIASISNENSFVSASSDKTVKLWSVKPELDDVECRWTYQNHTKPVQDVSILADNTIASSDGCLHIWDAFRSIVMMQLEWDGAAICGVEKIDRHTLAAISNVRSSIKLFDTRVGRWTSELELSLTSSSSAVTMAFAVTETNKQMAVALSDEQIAVVDARMGRIRVLTKMAAKFTNPMCWINENQIVTNMISSKSAKSCVIDVSTAEARIVNYHADSIVSASISNGLLTTIESNWLRVYNESMQMVHETTLRSDIFQSKPTTVVGLPLNSCYLIGTNQGSIRMMC